MQILKKTKKGMISTASLFFLLFICRVAVSLTYVQSLMQGNLDANMLISVAVAFVFTMVLAIPALLCVQRGINPLDVKGFGIFYAANFIFLAALNVSRFSYFAAARLSPDVQSWPFALLIFLSAAYAASLGLEGLSRFSGFAFVLILLSIGVVLGSNLVAFKPVHLWPESISPVQEILQNALSLSSNTAAVVAFPLLAEHVEKKKRAAFSGAMVASYAVMFLLLLFSIGVMGDGATVQAFPVYSLSQLARIGEFGRLDVLYTGFWILAIFVKISMLLYCSAISVQKFTHKMKCITFSALAFLLTLCMGMFASVGSGSAPVTIVLFLLFSTVFPSLALLIKKGDKRLENH